MWFSLGIAATAATATVLGGLYYYSNAFSTAVHQFYANMLSRKHVVINQNYYIVHYPYGVSWYKIIVPRNRRPIVIDSITDESGKDIKSEVIPFMGPGHNFHGLMVTPRMMGFDRITIEYGVAQKCIKTFETNQPILL